MRTLGTLLIAAAALSGCMYASDPTTGQGAFRLDRHDRLTGGDRGNPSAVIAAELAFARAARETGQWTAFREYATTDANMFGPHVRLTQEMLKGRADPAEAIVWEPDLVWTSCDGTYALSTGPATYPGGERGRFATIWQRQRNREYRWVLDQGFDLEPGYEKPDLIGGHVADCAAKDASRPARTQLANYASGQADDGTFAWETTLNPDCARTFVVRARVDGEWREVFRRVAPAPEAPPGGAAASCAS